MCRRSARPASRTRNRKPASRSMRPPPRRRTSSSGSAARWSRSCAARRSRRKFKSPASASSATGRRRRRPALRETWRPGAKSFPKPESRSTDVQRKSGEIEVLGFRLRYEEAGEGRPLLFLHGAAGFEWSPLLDALGARHRVIVPEHPGFGRSQIPSWMMGIGDVAFFYLDVLRALDLRDVHLVGHSVGGWIAAELAIRSTGRLASLGLVAPMGVAHPEIGFGDIFLWTADEFARRQFHDEARAEEWRKTTALLGIDTLLQNRAALARLGWHPRLSNPQLPTWLHRIDVPTLLSC